jgi:hypothetical protein
MAQGRPYADAAGPEGTMSDLYDLIMALPEGATLEIRRGERDRCVVIRLDLAFREQGVALGSDVMLERAMTANGDIVRIALDTKAAAILHHPDFGRVPA